MEQQISTRSGRQPCIFLVEEDDNVRPLLKKNLKRYGYRVLLALDEEDALDRVEAMATADADIVLIDLVGKTEHEVLKIGRRIREVAKFDARTPLVVMAEKFGADVEGTNVNVGGNDWITYLEDAHQLRNLLARLVSEL
jgi:DNA-binding response OmpR family regulator